MQFVVGLFGQKIFDKFRFMNRIHIVSFSKSLCQFTYAKLSFECVVKYTETYLLNVKSEKADIFFSLKNNKLFCQEIL